ncbi:MAG: hypothetical protein HZC36_02470 [Armatimonadetes bacterium]|nr:hypothetical protein [Armatimonadota bacterium]
MTTDPLRYSLDTSGTQLTKVYEGLSEDLMDAHLDPSAMSPREILEHLCECYVAYSAYAQGEKHDWGSYAAEDKGTGPLMSKCLELRASAIEKGLASESEGIRNASMDFIALHDCYHVGQVASLRIAKEPDWNSHSLYQ